MKKALLGSVLALTVASFGASAADMISKDEAHHFKLEYLGNVSVGASGGQISSPSDLHQKLSKLADEKGGKYYKKMPLMRGECESKLFLCLSVLCSKALGQ